MSMIKLEQKTPAEIDKNLAERIAGIRKRRKITQQSLSERSGVSLGSLKRFEQTGEISLSSLTKIAIALEIDSQLDELFTEIPFMSLDELIQEEKDKKKGIRQ